MQRATGIHLLGTVSIGSENTYASGTQPSYSAVRTAVADALFSGRCASLSPPLGGRLQFASRRLKHPVKEGINTL
jgi:hypothetical protein